MNNTIAILSLIVFALICFIFYKRFKNSPDNTANTNKTDAKDPLLTVNSLGISFSSEKAKQDYINEALEHDEGISNHEDKLNLMQFVLEDHIHGSKEIEIENTGYSICINLDRDDIASCGMMEIILAEAAVNVPSHVKAGPKKVHHDEGWTLITDHDRVEHYIKMKDMIKEVKKLLIAPDGGVLSPEKKEAFEYGIEPLNKPMLTLYALTSCRHCTSTKSFLDENNISYKLVFVDQYELTYRERISQTMKTYNPKGSFPTLVCPDGKVVVGYRLQLLKETLLNES